MKELISAKDIETAANKKEKVIYIPKNTIITPLAKELAKNYNIEFSTCTKENDICQPSDMFKDDFDINVVYKVFNIMKEKGILDDMLSLFSNKPYEQEVETGGLRIVRGNSVKFKSYNTGNEKDKVLYQEIINEKDQFIKGGFASIENSKFIRESKNIEIVYLVEGNLNIEINKKVFTAFPGDVLYIPIDSKVTWDSRGLTKLFYIQNSSK